MQPFQLPIKKWRPYGALECVVGGHLCAYSKKGSSYKCLERFDIRFIVAWYGQNKKAFRMSG